MNRRTRRVALALALTLTLARALDRDRNLGLVCDRNLARDRDRVLSRARARALIRTLERARGLEHRLFQATTQQGAVDGVSSTPGRVPRGLVALAARVLPAHERPRYREEFGVELVELPRRERLGYALRTLVRARELRRVLTPDSAPTRRGTPR